LFNGSAPLHVYTQKEESQKNRMLVCMTMTRR
jgi:hypothetical protein